MEGNGREKEKEVEGGEGTPHYSGQSDAKWRHYFLAPQYIAARINGYSDGFLDYLLIRLVFQLYLLYYLLILTPKSRLSWILQSAFSRMLNARIIGWERVVSNPVIALIRLFRDIIQAAT